MIFCFDIDNTICTTKEKIINLQNLKNVINLINELCDSQLYNKNFYIKIWAEIKRMQKKLDIKGTKKPLIN